MINQKDRMFELLIKMIGYLKAKETDKEVCKPVFLKMNRLAENFDEVEAFQLMKDSMQWLKTQGLIDTDLLREYFQEGNLNDNGIFTTGFHKVQDGFFIAFGNAQLEVAGLSRVVLFDESVANCYDQTFITGYDASHITVRNGIFSLFESASCIARDSLGSNYGDGNINHKRSLVTNPRT